MGRLGTPGGRPSQAKRRAGISVVVVEGGCLWNHGGQRGQSPEEQGATGFKAGGQGPVYGRARVGVGGAGGWAAQNGIREVMLEGPAWLGNGLRSEACTSSWSQHPVPPLPPRFLQGPAHIY